MRHLLSLFLAVFIWQGLIAQNYFNERFNFSPFPNSLFSSVLHHNDTLYILGVITDSISPFHPKALSARVDMYGNLIDFSAFKDSGYYYIGTYFNSLVKTDTGFAACGYTIDDEAMRSVIFFYNSSFRLTKLVEYNHPGYIQTDRYMDLTLINNYIYAVGHVQDTFFNINIQVIKCDLQGNVIWHKYIGNSVKQEMAYSLCANGSNIIINGNKNDDGFNNLMPKYYQNWLLEIDTNGIVLNEYLDPDSLTWGTMSIIGVDDGYILSGRYVDTPQVSPYLTLYSLGYIAKFDFDFNKVWEKKIASEHRNPFTNINTIRALDDGTFIGCGFGIDSFPVIGHNNAYVIKFTDEGDIYWRRSFYIVVDSFGEHNEFKDIEPLPNGWLAAVGSAYSSYIADNLPEQGWLVIMDSAGCLTPGCQFVGTEDAATGAVQLARVWPNPVSDFVYVTLAGQLFGGKAAAVRVSVSDMSGREVAAFEAKGEGQYLLPTHSWPSGSYVVSVWAGSEVHSEVVVKQ